MTRSHNVLYNATLFIDADLENGITVYLATGDYKLPVKSIRKHPAEGFYIVAVGTPIPQSGVKLLGNSIDEYVVAQKLGDLIMDAIRDVERITKEWIRL